MGWVLGEVNDQGYGENVILLGRTRLSDLRHVEKLLDSIGLSEVNGHSKMKVSGIFSRGQAILVWICYV